jgi:hypothetical protein
VEHGGEAAAGRSARFLAAAVMLALAQIALLAWAVLLYSHYLSRKWAEREDELAARLEVLEKRLDAMC